MLRFRLALGARPSDAGSGEIAEAYSLERMTRDTLTVYAEVRSR
jgi:hypothetical protein